MATREPRFRRIRIDLVDPDTRCQFCRGRARRLSTGIGHVLVGADGLERISGPSCARRDAWNWQDDVPDITRGAPEAPSDHPPDDDEETRDAGPEGDPSVPRAAHGVEEGRLAAEYVLLRCWRLAHHRNMRFGPLDEIYRERRALPLRPSDVRRVIAIMDVANKRYPQWTLANLQDCYAYDAWLRWGLCRLDARTEEARYVRAFLDYLASHGSLSQRQIGTASNILGRFRFRGPRSDAFGWARRA